MNINILKEHLYSRIEPTKDYLGNDEFRCSVSMYDGTNLPCVTIKSAEVRLQMAMSRIESTIYNGVKDARCISHYYPRILNSFINSGNRITLSNIKDVGISPNAIPVSLLRMIHGKASKSWTQFTGVMNDGNEFSFGTTSSCEFFQMPDGYKGTDIVEIISYKAENRPIFSECIGFSCYVFGLLDEVIYDNRFEHISDELIANFHI